MSARYAGPGQWGLNATSKGGAKQLSHFDFFLGRHEHCLKLYKVLSVLGYSHPELCDAYMGFIHEHFEALQCIAYYAQTPKEYAIVFEALLATHYFDHTIIYDRLSARAQSADPAFDPSLLEVFDVTSNGVRASH